MLDDKIIAYHNLLGSERDIRGSKVLLEILVHKFKREIDAAFKVHNIFQPKKEK